MICKFNSLTDLFKRFPDEQSCIRYLEWIVWKGHPVSPFDPTSKVYKCKNNQYKCKNTGKLFNVRYGTLFHRSSVPLLKWYVAIWMFMTSGKGLSSVRLSKDIEVTHVNVLVTRTILNLTGWLKSTKRSSEGKTRIATQIRK